MIENCLSNNAVEYSSDIEVSVESDLRMKRPLASSASTYKNVPLQYRNCFSTNSDINDIHSFNFIVQQYSKQKFPNKQPDNEDNLPLKAEHNETNHTKASIKRQGPYQNRSGVARRRISGKFDFGVKFAFS